MADVKKINGYDIKDAIARDAINGIKRIQNGAKKHTLNSTQNTVSITFPNACNNPPVFVASVLNPFNLDIRYWVSSISATGATLTVYAPSITSNTEVTIEWVAVEIS